MKLSNNFFLYEFQRSMTATRLDIDNTIPLNLVSNIRHLAQTSLQPLRNIYGKPIRITSGYRSPSLNSYIGGSKHSQHMEAEAADIDTSNDNLRLFRMIIDNKIPFDQLIWEFGHERPEWIHISLKAIGEPRQQVLRAYRDKYGVHYSPYIT